MNVHGIDDFFEFLVKFVKAISAWRIFDIYVTACISGHTSISGIKWTLSSRMSKCSFELQVGPVDVIHCFIYDPSGPPNQSICM